MMARWMIDHFTYKTIFRSEKSDPRLIPESTISAHQKRRERHYVVSAFNLPNQTLGMSDVMITI
jgi:hypothetical protein